MKFLNIDARIGADKSGISNSSSIAPNSVNDDD